MIFTTRFKVLIGLLVALILLSGIIYNQFTLQKELTAQMQFDTKVMQQDQKVWKEVEQKATVSAAPKTTPTPKLIVGSNKLR